MPRFHYTPTTPDAGSIGDLMLRRGQIAGNRARMIADIEAQAAMARGQIWGGTVAGIAGSVGDLISGYARQKAEAPARALEHATKAADLRLKETQIAEAGQKADERDRLTRRETAWMGLLEMEGLSPDVLQREMLRIYGPKDAATMLGGLKAFADLQAGQVTDAKQTTLGLTAAWKKASPALRAQFWPGLREAVITGGLLPAESTPEEPPDDAFMSAVEAWARGKEPEAPELMNVPPGSAVLDPVTRQPVFTNPREVQPSNPTEASLAAAAAAGDTQAARALDLLRQQRAQSGRSPYFIPLQTGQGVVSFDTRTGGLAGRVADLKPGETAQREIANAQTTATILDQVLGSIDESKIGPAMGRYKTAEALLTGGDPEFAACAAAVQTLQNTVINLRTGAQMSELEAQRILGELSDVNLPPATFMARAKQGQKYFNEWLKNRANVAYGRTTTQDVDRMVAPPSDADDAYAAYLKRQGAGRAR